MPVGKFTSVQYHTKDTIFIACLGLFALSAFTIEQRIPEIGIRKIMGASVMQIIQLLGKEFLVLVLIAAVIALPLSYYYLNIWLSEFAYHISIHTTMMMLVVLLTLLLALAVISYHAFRAARANPVDALMFE